LLLRAAGEERALATMTSQHHYGDAWNLVYFALTT